jgi:glucose-6-phosphate 1-dehydrogenase
VCISTTDNNESRVGILPDLRDKVHNDIMLSFLCIVAIEAPSTVKGTKRSQIMNLVKDWKESDVKYNSRNIICGMFWGIWER